MKIFLTSFIVLSFSINCFAQTGSGAPQFATSYNIGKSEDTCIFSSDSIPVFLIKGDGKSIKIASNKIKAVSPKNNCLLNDIPTEAIKEIYIFKDTKESMKYGKEGAYGLCEVYLLDGKMTEITKLLKNKKYIK